MYTITRKSLTGKKEEVFRSEDLQEVMNYFNKNETELEGRHFDSMIEEYFMSVSENQLFETTFCDFINHYGSIGELNTTQQDMEEYEKGKLILLLCRNNTDISIDLCKNEEIEIYYSCKYLVERMFEKYEIDRKED